jgi:hypothetical protein
MTQRLPLAFYVNGVAVAMFFIATQISAPQWRTTLQWLGGAAVLCAVVLLIMKK